MAIPTTPPHWICAYPFPEPSLFNFIKQYDFFFQFPGPNIVFNCTSIDSTGSTPEGWRFVPGFDMPLQENILYIFIGLCRSNHNDERKVNEHSINPGVRMQRSNRIYNSPNVWFRYSCRKDETICRRKKQYVDFNSTLFDVPKHSGRRMTVEKSYGSLNCKTRKRNVTRSTVTRRVWLRRSTVVGKPKKYIRIRRRSKV